jgi:hypothetical protein
LKTPPGRRSAAGKNSDLALSDTHSNNAEAANARHSRGEYIHADKQVAHADKQIAPMLDQIAPMLDQSAPLSRYLARDRLGKSPICPS